MCIRDRFQQRINPSADLDEKTLNYIADTTGGQYFRAHNPQELDAIYKKLDALEPVEQEAEVFRPISSLFYIPLALSLSLIILAMLVHTLRHQKSLFSEQRSKSIPGTKKAI